MKKSQPNYKLIYTDIIDHKFPEKKKECEGLLRKENLSVLNIIELNQRIFGINKEHEEFNRKLRSYTKSDILEILKYQQEYQCTNSHLASHFKLSRNTVTKWKKMLLI
ncbi:helix-turn-helix domain-containing protein [Chryseobacterium arthrosphaerae]|uniref:Helix-turn-helix domain-containing protein n=1 Tax=Chryseobacterium arthrosphaerae TaxID=651561 RepID=A0ABU7QXZ8_9FLAO|nr:helix-turn-helix domain-containing protein [Chryseobacterium arthrosphaerae]AYZ13024.1 helix-turn-helix domain-containing protein [Chryseobacterium arthrosphaerae]MDG4651136.1 helix-turn-helix domain-containing protein [Chryseobacterium arthrosphaerae]